MSVSDKLNVGIVGAAGRGKAYRSAFDDAGARIHAVCDIQEDKLEECRQTLGASEKYTDYAEMLESSELDAVVVATPMPLHTQQSVMALERNIHVLSEVPACVSLEECHQLVRACAESEAMYMMAENYVYMKPNMVIRELVKQGLFGEVYYAEGEYLHELKKLNEMTPWRRQWQTGIAGVTYGTHSLGPILQWMRDDRVVQVCCADSSVHSQDPRGDYYAQQTPVMLCKTQRGALIKIRIDMVSDRPHAMSNYQLQGTDGVYESARGGPGESNKIWLREMSGVYKSARGGSGESGKIRPREMSEGTRWYDLDAEGIRWYDLDVLVNDDTFAQRYVPEMWRNPPQQALESGHAGGDYFEVQEFVGAIQGEIHCPIGIHEAMDMTLPGLVSQQSIRQSGKWLTVPDSRTWADGRFTEQLQMIWPEELLDSPPVPNLPEEYLLRCYRDDDKAEYLELREKVGFSSLTPQQLAEMLCKVLPDGFFVVIHRRTQKIVGTAMALHHPQDYHPYGGELGWVGVDPEHRGKALGLAVCAAVVARLLRAGYRRIYLLTDDFRLPAIRTYLELGFKPFIVAENMQQRWQQVYETLGWPSTG